MIKNLVKLAIAVACFWVASGFESTQASARSFHYGIPKVLQHTTWYQKGYPKGDEIKIGKNALVIYNYAPFGGDPYYTKDNHSSYYGHRTWVIWGKFGDGEESGLDKGQDNTWIYIHLSKSHHAIKLGKAYLNFSVHKPAHFKSKETAYRWK